MYDDDKYESIVGQNYGMAETQMGADMYSANVEHMRVVTERVKILNDQTQADAEYGHKVALAEAARKHQLARLIGVLSGGLSMLFLLGFGYALVFLIRIVVELF